MKSLQEKQMHKIIWTFIFLLLGFGIVGCNSEVIPQTTNGIHSVTPSPDMIVDLPTKILTKVAEPTILPTLTPTLTPHPTQIPTPTKQYNVTNIPTPTSIEVQELCGTVHTDPSEIPAEIMEGIVIEGIWDDTLGIAVQGEDVNTPAFIQPVPTGSWTTKVSPDGKWLAFTEAVEYDEFGNATILDGVVLNPISKEVFRTRIQDELVSKLNLSGFQWLNDTQLVIHTLPESKTNVMTYIIWSPFTGETQTLSFQLPGYEHILFGGTVYPIIDPFLEYIIYPCYDGDICGDKDFRIQDIASGKEAWATESMISPYSFPRNVQWSPDGKFVAVFDKDQPDLINLNIFDRDGERVHEMTLPSLGFGGGYKWSPDEKYIAFLRSQKFGQEEQTVANLVYADLVSGEVFDLCISNIQKFYWSPDSAKIVTEFADATSENSSDWVYEATVVDIASGDKYKWYETDSPGFLLGWAVPVVEP